MKLNPFTAWSLGFLIILLSIILGELSIAFNDYVYERIGVNQNILAIIFWCLFGVGAYIASYYSKGFKLLLGLSFIFITPLTVAIAHYLNGRLGSVIDFDGLSGTVVVFKIYFFTSSFFVLIGTFLGVFFSREKINGVRRTQ